MSLPFHPAKIEDSLSDMLATLLILITGREEDGSHYWAYMAIKPSAAASISNARDTQLDIDLENLGTVLERGEGKQPPADMIEKMREDYGMRPDYEDRLVEAIKKSKI